MTNNVHEKLKHTVILEIARIKNAEEHLRRTRNISIKDLYDKDIYELFAIQDEIDPLNLTTFNHF